MTRITRSANATAIKASTLKVQKPVVSGYRGATSRAQTATGDLSKPNPKSRSTSEAQPRPFSSAKTHTGDAKYKAWSQHATSSPFPDFLSPTPEQCRQTYAILEAMHGATMRDNFAEMDDPQQAYPHVMDALVVAQLSQATSWSNAQRAMKSMARVYGSTFAYQSILDGGIEKLQDALRPGGMQNRKAKMLTQLLLDVKERHGSWDLDFMFKLSDDEAMKEVLQYHGIGPKSAFCLLSICLQRQSFAVDTHIYRISGLWGWRPKDASREKAQAHLNARIPAELKFPLHYLLIVHGRECPQCRGNGDASAVCKYKQECRALAGTS